MLMIDSAAVRSAMLSKEFGVMKLSKLAKIPPKTISTLHRRDKAVYLPTLSRLARALQVNPMELVKGANGRGNLNFR